MSTVTRLRLGTDLIATYDYELRVVALLNGYVSGAARLRRRRRRAPRAAPTSSGGTPTRPVWRKRVLDGIEAFVAARTAG